MTEIVQKLIVVPAENLDTSSEFGRVALINSDGTPFLNDGAKDRIQLRSANGTVWDVIATDDGTLTVTAA